MNIYTYYEEIGFDSEIELELIETWKESWSKNGYNPIVLTKVDVESHNFYREFCDKINNIHEQIMGKSITKYGLACFVRWLAYANLKNQGKFYVSDYDVINKNYPVIHPVDKLHLMDGQCPNIASGNSSHFIKLCRMFIELSQKNISYIKSQIKEPHYHDQEFFVYNYPNISTVCLTEFIITRSRPTIGEYNLYEQNNPDTKIFHVAHSNVDKLKSLYPEILEKNQSDDEIRLAAAKNLLTNQ